MPYGTLQADKVADSYNASLAPISVPFRNRIINGTMVIDQRNAGASVTPTNVGGANYTLDRWNAQILQASKFSVQQNAGSVTTPVGFSKYLGITSLSAYSVVSGDYFRIDQSIEGFNTADLMWGTVNAQTVTLSFLVRSSLTGTFGGVIANSAFNRCYPFSYSIPVANTWTQISVTITGDTTGTWLTDNGIGVRVSFSLGAGSTYSGTAGAWTGSTITQPTGATSVVGTSGATFYITGVQLEKGSNATSFDYRPYGTELSLCQRYYWQMGKDIAYSNFGNGFSGSATINYLDLPLKQTMRVVPTLVTTGTASNYQVLLGLSAIALSVVPTIDALNSNTDIVLIASTVATGLTIGQGGLLRANNTTSAFLGFNSEL